jgi:hypothetical protein
MGRTGGLVGRGSDDLVGLRTGMLVLLSLLLWPTPRFSERRLAALALPKALP